ncbi:MULTISPECIES: hypothetical protein [unclassified Pseudoalteromonas]|uniref:hypothetical protein n=1 Tax=unclassified Pseudoalteromonas TaxID=194690 RepID=UPI0030142199
MIVNLLKDYLNIGFSFVLMIVMAFLIIKGFVADHKYTSGYIEYFECFKDVKTESTYQYNLKMKNDDRFRNRIKVPCETIPDISKGDYVSIESIGHIFTQITIEDVELFDKASLERRSSGVNFIFILLFLLAIGDLVYRLYFKKRIKNQRNQIN